MHISLQITESAQTDLTYHQETKEYQYSQNTPSITIVLVSLLLLPNLFNSGLFSFPSPPHLFRHEHPLFSESSPHSCRWGCWSFIMFSMYSMQSFVCVSGNPTRLLFSMWERWFLTCWCSPSAWHLLGSQLVFDTWMNECKHEWRDPLT